jgi:hypothetical protein
VDWGNERERERGREGGRRGRWEGDKKQQRKSMTIKTKVPGLGMGGDGWVGKQEQGGIE